MHVSLLWYYYSQVIIFIFSPVSLSQWYIMFYALCSLSLIAVALLPALVEAVATLHYNATSGCPGDDLVFICLASNTIVLRWTVTRPQIGFTSNRNNSDQQPQSVNEGEIPFGSYSNVHDNRSLPIDGADIVAHLTKKRCHSNRSCFMESQLVFSIGSNMGNLILSCQSNGSHDESNVTTKSGEYNAYVHVCIRCTIFVYEECWLYCKVIWISRGRGATACAFLAFGVHVHG